MNLYAKIKLKRLIKPNNLNSNKFKRNIWFNWIKIFYEAWESERKNDFLTPNKITKANL